MGPLRANAARPNPILASITQTGAIHWMALYPVQPGDRSASECGQVVLTLERKNDGASIASFPDAFCWAMRTVTTSGDGDLAPRILGGRTMAIFLIIGGFALYLCVTANLQFLPVLGTIQITFCVRWNPGDS